MEFSTILFICILIWFFCVRSYTFSPKKYVDRSMKSADAYQVYESKSILAPTLRGFPLKVVTVILNSMFGHYLFSHFFLTVSKLKQFRTINMREVPTYFPFVSPKHIRNYPQQEESRTLDDSLASFPNDDHHFECHSIADFVEAYKTHQTTPSAVIENILSAMKNEDVQFLNTIIACNEDDVRLAAKASTERYQCNNPLSAMDGIPVNIKDEIEVSGYKCNFGTEFIGTTEEKEDASVVDILRRKGAIIIGISNMHEFGNGTTGSNPGKSHGTCRNPHNTAHYTGGSSSGAACANAVGLSMIGLGTDGGGSVRIPAAFCGLVGLKPTYGRLSLDKTRIMQCSVVNIGPLCNTVKDATLAYAMLADAKNEQVTFPVPPIILPDFSSSLIGLKIGIDKPYNRDSDDDVYNHCSRVVNYLETCGCHAEPINIPESNEARLAHLIIILSEMVNAQMYYLDNHFDELTWETRVLFTLNSHFQANDFIRANQQRTRCIRFFREIFENVDVIITPSTGHTAPPIHNSELETGSVLVERDVKTMRYMYFANLVGLPCITVPVGFDSNGLPIGVQVMGPWWREDLVLRVAAEIEKMSIVRRKPQVYYDVLSS